MYNPQINLKLKKNLIFFYMRFLSFIHTIKKIQFKISSD